MPTTTVTDEMSSLSFSSPPTHPLSAVSYVIGLSTSCTPLLKKVIRVPHGGDSVSDIYSPACAILRSCGPRSLDYRPCIKSVAWDCPATTASPRRLNDFYHSASSSALNPPVLQSPSPPVPQSPSPPVPQSSSPPARSLGPGP
ncbi:hypothetical protein K504DRAFT_84982 [Pleomassaria siparia CBS 279.74]|uniref:Uncharacterized protein n=1 Tax=Pleomassaria siparia CBS 279.74 TaxID=1314801 RepID=A0A6G1JZZ0_9PLEO|nr:hypothetical protein K504DRAFT_84982 [Pleomassaria siparia CBS 279.74]